MKMFSGRKEFCKKLSAMSKCLPFFKKRRVLELLGPVNERLRYAILNDLFLFTESLVMFQYVISRLLDVSSTVAIIPSIDCAFYALNIPVIQTKARCGPDPEADHQHVKHPNLHVVRDPVRVHVRSVRKNRKAPDIIHPNEINHQNIEIAHHLVLHRQIDTDPPNTKTDGIDAHLAHRIQ